MLRAGVVFDGAREHADTRQAPVSESADRRPSAPAAAGDVVFSISLGRTVVRRLLIYAGGTESLSRSKQGTGTSP